jgi:hypothetical protein
MAKGLMSVWDIISGISENHNVTMNQLVNVNNQDTGHNSWQPRRFFVYNVDNGLIIHMIHYRFVS